MMERFTIECQTALDSTPGGSGLTGLLLCRDLIFTSKIKGTVSELGYSLMVAGSYSQARSMIEEHRLQVVLVDLAGGELVVPAALITYQELAGPGVWFVAFGSHVDVRALAGAKAAGCHVVLPRSRFAADLPVLIRQYFTLPPTRGG